LRQLFYQIVKEADIRTSELYTHCLVEDQEKVRRGKVGTLKKKILYALDEINGVHMVFTFWRQLR
jgi:hypothetical protein